MTAPAKSGQCEGLKRIGAGTMGAFWDRGQFLDGLLGGLDLGTGGDGIRNLCLILPFLVGRPASLQTT